MKIKQWRGTAHSVYVQVYDNDGYLKHEQIFYNSLPDDSWESACQYSAGICAAFRLACIEYTFDASAD